MTAQRLTDRSRGVPAARLAADGSVIVTAVARLAAAVVIGVGARGSAVPVVIGVAARAGAVPVVIGVRTRASAVPVRTVLAFRRAVGVGLLVKTAEPPHVRRTFELPLLRAL